MVSKNIYFSHLIFEKWLIFPCQQILTYFRCPILFGINLLFKRNKIKKETLAKVFLCKFCEISKNTFFTEHLWATASVKWRMSLFLLRIYFCFFQRTDSLISCIKQSQSYLKSQKIEIKFNLEILFYTVFIGKLQKVHLFKSSRPTMFYK